MDKVSLTASMRSNLLSLQNISRQVDVTQNRLSTGKKVNSAIDNPSSYYTARALTNRANDLDALLDSMGQAVSTIKAATTALETAADFLEQASAVATQALESTQPIAARVSTEEELLTAVNSGKRGLIVLDKDIIMSTNQNIELKDGQSLVGVSYLDKSKPKTKLTFNFDGILSSGIVAANNSIISNLDISLTENTFAEDVTLPSGNSKGAAIMVKENVSAHISDVNISLNLTGHFITRYSGIAGVSQLSEIILGGTINIKDVSQSRNRLVFGICGGRDDHNSNTNSYLILNNAVLNIDLQKGESLSYGIYTVDAELRGNSRINVKTSSPSSVGIAHSNISLYDNSVFNYYDSGNRAYGSYGKDFIMNVYDSAAVNIKADSADSVGFSNDQIINLQSASALLNIDTGGNSFNNNSISMVTGASFVSNGKLYTAVSDINGLLLTGSDFNQAEFIVSAVNVPAIPDIDEEMAKEAPQASKDNDSSKQYAGIVSQYDSLIKDSSYKGVNLLQSQDLKVTFNESRSAWLDVKGQDASSAALGIKTVEWQTQEDVVAAVKELTDALNKIRSMSSELGSYYNIVLNRQDFTENLINVLEEGADKLTLADMNEESANMLALQTRQQLATNSLSLASQAAQSILRLF